MDIDVLNNIDTAENILKKSINTVVDLDGFNIIRLTLRTKLT